MPRIADLPLWLRSALKVYPWRRLDPVPAAALRKPVAQSRIALVTTAGLAGPGDPLFDPNVKGGDFSFRVIPAAVDVRTLTEHHRSRSFDHAGLLKDRNLVFPLDRLRELAAEGAVGEVAPRHLSFMGSITAPGRLVRRSAPEAASILTADAVDGALFFPV